MGITEKTMAALFVALSAAFGEGLNTPPPVDLVEAGLVTEVTSTTASQQFPIEEAPEGFREWFGDREWKDIMAFLYEIKNRDFELSRKMKRKTLADDQHGVFATFLKAKGWEWPMQKYEMMIEVLQNQHNVYTGKKLFATNHSKGYEGTLSNKSTTALSATELDVVILAASAWKFSNGKLVRPRWTHLLHGPKLRDTVNQLVVDEWVSTATATDDATTTYVAGRKGNKYHRAFVPMEIPDFVGDYDDYWALLDCSKPIKPLILQTREVPKFVMDTDPRQIEFTGEIRMGASGRAAAGASFPHLAIGGVL
ncbi:MAG: hypothetical protein HON70_06345 [Lentisphaerae bacterium]|jgi:phage major head subunit gpT-like protein|nr:hypothetical protein [Lentisphaerota bacterium]